MLLTFISIILQLISVPIGLYYLIIGFCGFLPIPDRRKRIKNKLHRFAVVAAAHNEEAVIGELIRSLKALDYTDYDIFIIADNCTDRTAEIARALGAEVLERFSRSKRGKGYALEWFFERLFNMEKKYDYVAVFDADNLVAPDFLRRMNESANSGHKVVQGFLDSKNPYDSWITASYSFCFWSINRIFQLARYKIGLCCELSGTGFVIQTELLKRLGWGAHCLTEDMEFTMKSMYCGEKIAFNYDARVYDEKPLTLMQSWRQRVRWMRGHSDVASRYFFPLVKKGIRELSLSCIDCAVYLIQPIRIIAMGIILFFAYAQSFYPAGDLGFVQLWYIFKSPLMWNVISIFQLLYMPFLVVYERRELTPRMIFYFALYPVYNLTWIPIAFWGLLTHKKRGWAHTSHTRALRIDEVM